MTEPSGLSRLWYVGGAAAISVAFVGFLTGTRKQPDPVGPRPPRATASGRDVMPAYSAIGAARRGPNAHLYDGAFERLHPNRDLFAKVEQSEEDHENVLLVRAERRAYDGAPPTIPHDIDQRQFPDCLVCHEEGAVVAGKRAPAMSHARYDSCTQCHAPSSGPPTPLHAPVVENAFAGVAASGRLPRAWPGAPPVIPHATLMRSECMSCHGPLGAHGIRTTHPWRQSCTQCHVPSAALDQRDKTAGPMLRGINDG